MGQSVGHWEGDTLVVDVTGFNDRPGSIAPATSTASSCTSSSATRAPAPDVISYEATIEDPETFTRPWKISMPLYRRLEKNAQLMEFKCVEFVEELMYGAVAEEAADQVDRSGVEVHEFDARSAA